MTCSTLQASAKAPRPGAVAEKLDGMTPTARQEYMTALLEAEGIHHDYMAVDEGHSLLDRQGKENSRMANVLHGVAHGRKYYVAATADPVKNDVSEAFSVLNAMDPNRYHDRDAFMRKYGVNTSAARDGLRREMARHFYTGRIDPGVKANKTEHSVPLHPEQQEQLRKLDDAASRASHGAYEGWGGSGGSPHAVAHLVRGRRQVAPYGGGGGPQ